MGKILSCVSLTDIPLTPAKKVFHWVLVNSPKTLLLSGQGTVLLVTEDDPEFTWWREHSHCLPGKAAVILCSVRKKAR